MPVNGCPQCGGIPEMQYLPNGWLNSSISSSQVRWYDLPVWSVSLLSDSVCIHFSAAGGSPGENPEQGFRADETGWIAPVPADHFLHQLLRKNRKIKAAVPETGDGNTLLGKRFVLMQSWKHPGGHIAAVCRSFSLNGRRRSLFTSISSA